ncbi:MAG: YebC/PmpR family DNA-binding transcriptional regulator [Planctomycetota bacterium]
MAGHSHWAGIKHKKGAADKRRGKIFSKHARAIMTAARLGGGDPEMNLRLKYAVDKARADNMPKDSIERAIKKGTGNLGAGELLEEVQYEGFGPGGVAILVESLTDNRNRTVPEIRRVFEKRGGSMGEAGSVAWMFEKKALFVIPAASVDEDKLFEVAIEAGAQDVRLQGDSLEVVADPTEFAHMRGALANAGIVPSRAEMTQMPKATVTLDAETGRQVLALLEDLEEHEDVQGTWSNFDIPESVMAELAEQEGRS